MKKKEIQDQLGRITNQGNHCVRLFKGRTNSLAIIILMREINDLRELAGLNRVSIPIN